MLTIALEASWDFVVHAVFIVSVYSFSCYLLALSCRWGALEQISPYFCGYSNMHLSGVLQYYIFVCCFECCCMNCIIVWVTLYILRGTARPVQACPRHTTSPFSICLWGFGSPVVFPIQCFDWALHEFMKIFEPFKTLVLKAFWQTYKKPLY